MGNFSVGVCGRPHLNQVIEDITNNGTYPHHVLLDMVHWENQGMGTPVIPLAKTRILTQSRRKQLEN